ncbi:MAG: YihY family inner membrane protein [Campylobacter sp.]|nr:YihY family inner membrane protein [Campylobacter sp.]
MKFIDKTKALAEKIYDKEIFNHSASLSFHTLLSIIPILFISFSIFTQLPSFEGHYENIKNFIFSSLLPSHQDSVSNYLDNFLSNSGNLGLFGFISVILITIMFFTNYMYVVERITGSKSRGFWQEFSKYWTLMTLAPLGLVLSFYISAKLQSFLDESSITSWINIASILPYLIIWAIFTVVYIISINLKAKVKNIVISSLLTSLTWNFSKFFFIQYTLYNKTYLSIYGSFSVLLFFFVWIYLSWVIFLYGFKIYEFLENRQNSIKIEISNDIK